MKTARALALVLARLLAEDARRRLRRWLVPELDDAISVHVQTPRAPDRWEVN